jgi:hypothetical protein
MDRKGWNVLLQTAIVLAGFGSARVSIADANDEPPRTGSFGAPSPVYVAQLHTRGAGPLSPSELTALNGGSSSLPPALNQATAPEIENPRTIDTSENLPESNAQGTKNAESEGDKAPNEQLSDDYTTKEEFDAAGKDTVARKQEYGEQRTDNTQQFLRTVTPLLQPGKWQFDYGVAYSINEVEVPNLFGPFLTEENYQIRSLNSIIGFRYGISDRLQWFGNTTVGWQSTEVTNGFNRLRDDTGGLGDIVTGFNYLLRRESECSPAIITSFDMTAPTGNPRNPLTLSDSGTGLGAWSFSSDLLMIKSIDPLVTFWGLGYRTFLEDNYVGNDVRIGDSIQYTFGMGFGVNEKVTLSSVLIGAYVLDTKVNSTRISGSAGDIISLRFAATILKECKIVEPFITFGLTERATDTSLGIVWTR